MIPRSFEYFTPTTLAEAQTLLRKYGGEAQGGGRWTEPHTHDEAEARGAQVPH